jgi:hypothetical protein
VQSSFNLIAGSPQGAQVLEEALQNLLHSPDAEVRLQTAQSLEVTLQRGEVRLNNVLGKKLCITLISLLRRVEFPVHRDGIDPPQTVIAQEMSPSLRPGACFL